MRFLLDDAGVDVDDVLGVLCVSFGVGGVLAFPRSPPLALVRRDRAPYFAVSEVSGCEDGDDDASPPTAAPDLVPAPSTDSSSTLGSARTDLASSASAMSREPPMKLNAPATRLCASAYAAVNLVS